MSQLAVRASVIAAIRKTLDESFSDPPVAWPNRKFNVPANADLWFEVFYTPGKPTATTLGDQGEDEVLSFAQIQICTLSGKGERDTLKAVACLEAAFFGGCAFTKDGQTVTVQTAQVSNGMLSDGWWKTPFSIYFRASYQRPSLIT